jgi:hypothetical protein
MPMHLSTLVKSLHSPNFKNLTNKTKTSPDVFLASPAVCASGSNITVIVIDDQLYHTTLDTNFLNYLQIEQVSFAFASFQAHSHDWMGLYSVDQIDMKKYVGFQWKKGQTGLFFVLFC